MPTDTISQKGVQIMKRTKMPQKKDRQVFKSTSKPHPANSTVRHVMRGGIRK